jgi:hypothetical protein
MVEWDLEPPLPEQSYKITLQKMMAQGEKDFVAIFQTTTDVKFSKEICGFNIITIKCLLLQIS